MQSAGAASVAGAAVCSAALLVSQGRKAGTVHENWKDDA